MSNRVSYEEQVESGLVRQPRRNLILPAKQAEAVRRLPTHLNTVQHTIDVQPSSTYSVEMRTSAVDRSKGFLLATVPLFAGFAFGFVLIATLFFSVPFLSLTALVIFWLSFVLSWLVSYIYTLLVSAEGIAFYEARMKWKVIIREQSERWRYYHDDKEQAPTDHTHAILLVVVAICGVLMILVEAFYQWN